MYCQSCGTKNAAEANVCIRCGKRIFTSEAQRDFYGQTAEQTAAAAESGNLLGSRVQSASPPSKKKKTGGAFAWIIPLLLLGVVAVCLMLLHTYELRLNDEVIALQKDAQAEAMEGHYAQAAALLDSAVAKRPGFSALLQDRAVAVEAVKWQNQLQSAAEGLKEQQLQSSETAINAVAQELKGREEPAYNALRNELVAAQVKLAVMKVKSELDTLDTVDKLAAKLKSVESLDGEEAAAIKKQIVTKLAGLSRSTAEKLLQQKDFAGALQAVDRGLTYAPEDEQLIAYRKRIASEKLAFEQAEQERIELASQQAAFEDMKNRTAAVVLQDSDVTLDEYGDLQISGTILNDATRTIYSIDLTLSIYTASGSYLGQTYASVYPYSLAPGESGQFSAAYYGAYEEAQFTVEQATWYLE